MRIILFGASGQLGREILTQAKAHGHWVRAVSRNPLSAPLLTHYADEVLTADLVDPGALVGACRDVDAVISAAGASMKTGAFGNRRSYYWIDYRGNANILAEAKRAGVSKFLYVSVFGARAMPEDAYANAHALFERELEASGLEYSIVRPTGLFYFYTTLVDLALRGRGLKLGNGTAQTNPIHEADAAGICMDALEGKERVVDCGGPEVFSRAELMRTAFRVAGKQGRMKTISPTAFLFVSSLIWPFNPRISDLMKFGVRVSTRDVVAPTVGEKRIEEYFREYAGTKVRS